MRIGLSPADQRQNRALHPHLLGGWPYGAIYRTSIERTRARQTRSTTCEGRWS